MNHILLLLKQPSLEKVHQKTFYFFRGMIRLVLLARNPLSPISIYKTPLPTKSSRTTTKKESGFAPDSFISVLSEGERWVIGCGMPRGLGGWFRWGRR